MKTIIRPILLLCLACTVPAIGCGGEAKKADDKAAKADVKKDAPTKAPDADKPTDEAPKPSMDTPEGRVALAAIVATEIAGSPDKADEILEQNGLDRDKLDDLMYEIARDPELSRAYKEQRMNG